MLNSQEVFENHLRAVATLDAVEVMKDYSEDALYITPDHTYRGRNEIKVFYDALLAKMKDFKIEVVKQETEGNIAYLVWKGKNEMLEVEFATDTYIVENGKISCHTFAGIMK